MSQFHPIETPIQAGLTLLEAGAGTGKTYSLVRLVARQIVEQDIPIEQILTVTFTKAATAEIQSRLQALLHQLFTELSTPLEAEALDLTSAWLMRGEDFRNLAIERLRVALCSFDRANIFTIDSFFQRLTKEFSLDCRTLSSLEIEPQNDALIDMAVRDYWRNSVYPMSAEEYEKLCPTLGQAKDFIKTRLQTPNAILNPAYQADLSQYQGTWQDFTQQLQQYLPQLEEFLANKTDCFHKGKPPFNVTKKRLLEYLHSILTCPPEIDIQSNLLKLLTVEYLAQPTLLKKGQSFSLNDHPLLPLFESVAPLMNIPEKWQHCIQLGDIESYVQQRLPQIKAAQGVQTYDDITQNLYELLQTTRGDSVRNSCQEKYRAVSIDEFQDTSPYQCDIFLKLFHHTGGSLHIIGDPKQSIYSFRGADVFAYLEARSLANQRYELLINHRSSSSLVKATNLLFQQIEDPFFSGQAIEFQPASAAGQLLPAEPALDIRYIEGNEEEEVCKDVTSQIIYLLGKQWNSLYPDKPGTILASDVSILVRSSRQAQLLFQTLSRAGIPASIRTSSNLFQSPEAQEFRILLDAILRPHHNGALKLALLTPALGAGQLLHRSEDDLLSLIEIFTAAHQIWSSRGLLPAINQLDRKLNLRQQLLRLTSGERRVTNYFHLAELLDTKARQDNLYPLALTHWLESALQGDKGDLESETDQLRISSDSHAVQIQTIHTSKGLQFPIVFIPFTYGGIRKDRLVYHQDGKTHIAPVGDKATAIDQRIAEEKADTARLLYVALTRAELRCIVHVDLLKKKSTKTIAFHEMLGHPTEEDWVDIQSQSGGSLRFTHITPEQIDTYERYQPPIQLDESVLQLECAPELTSRPERQHSTTSFTGLTRNLPDPRDTDPTELFERGNLDYIQNEPFWTNFQPGAALGLVFHEFFEEADFQDTLAHQQLLEAKLEKYQPYRGNTKPSSSIISQIVEWIPTMLTHQLHSFLPIRLSEVGHYQRLNEAQFLLSAHDLSLEQFADILEESPPPYLPVGYTRQLRQMPRSQFTGFLDGIIDLVFEHGGRYHILDWKTNQVSDGSSQGLAHTMAHHHYFLQYHLYSLALDALLRHRLKDYDPELHLGEVFYVFFRAVIPGKAGTGVYHDRLSTQRLTKLANTFHLEPEEELC